VTRGHVHHVDLAVRDLDVSVPYYDLVLTHLGYRRTDQYAGDAPCWVHSSRIAFGIALHPARSSAPHDRYAAGLHHLAFHAASREEVDAMCAFLRRNDVQIRDEPAEYDYTPGYYAVFFADPDGMKLEVVYEPAG
jgi:catechol 2,3-dioxygenase-like lactoylglutathione lyase family enzyme